MNIFQRAYNSIRPPAGKAISRHPELAGRVHVHSEYASDGTHSNPNANDYNEVYASYVWVRKAVSKCSENIGPLGIGVVNAEGEPMADHPVSVLLNRGNDSTSPSAMWQEYVATMLLSGEWFVEIVDDARGRPVELWPRSPDEVLVALDVSPERVLYPRVAAYKWQPSGSDKPIILDPPSMIHSKFFNPVLKWRGLSPVAAVREGITIDLFSQAWSKSFLKRGARPDFAIITPEGITQTERERYEAEFMRKNAGSENWHRPIILEQGITDIKPFSFAPADIEWLEQRKFSRDEVGAIFGVPDEVMGYGKDTYENFQTAIEMFWTLTLKPLAEHRDDLLRHFFTYVRPLLKPGERVQTDFSGVGVLQEEMKPKVEMAVQLSTLGYSANEINERLSLGMPDVIDPEPMAEAEATAGALSESDEQDGKTAQESLYLPDPVRKAVEAEANKAGEIRRKLSEAGTLDPERWHANAMKALRKWLDDDDARGVVDDVVAEFEAAARMGVDKISPHQHQHEAIKALQIGDPDIDPLLTEYETGLEQIITDAVEGKDDKAEFEKRMRDLVLAFLALGFFRGIGADSEDELEPDQLAALSAARNRASESITSLSDDVFNGDKYAENLPDDPGRTRTAETGLRNATNRMGLWVASLAGIYAAGQVRKDRDQAYVWRLGNTKEHCGDCLRLNGQVHTSAAWVSSGYQPQGRSLECGGWNCDCRFEETDRDERGGF